MVPVVVDVDRSGDAADYEGDPSSNQVEPEHGARTRRSCFPFFQRGCPPTKLLVEDSSLDPHPEQ